MTTANIDIFLNKNDKINAFLIKKIIEKEDKYVKVKKVIIVSYKEDPFTKEEWTKHAFVELLYDSYPFNIGEKSFGFLGCIEDGLPFLTIDYINPNIKTEIIYEEHILSINKYNILDFNPYINSNFSITTYFVKKGTKFNDIFILKNKPTKPTSIYRDCYIELLDEDINTNLI
jgi:hypothetical protein